MLRATKDAALEELFERLELHDDWLSGYFAALTIGPDSVANSAWLDPLVDRTRFSKDELPGVIALLLAMQEAIRDAVRDDPERVVPGTGDVDGGARFANGFLAGARLHPSWRRDEIAIVRLLPFALLAGEVPDDELIDADDKPIVDKEAFFARHRAELAQHVASARAHWLTRSAGSKISRNDPCPCGSGKKYKKCCLP